MNESICPVSGLPVVSKPEWSDLKISANYHVTFQKIGDSILLHLPYGDMKQFNSNLFYEHRENVIKSAFAPDQKFIDLKSYKHLVNSPTGKERKNVYNRLYQEKDRLLGFLVYDLSTIVRFMYQAAFDLAKDMPFPCKAVDNYQTAISYALDILGLSQPDIGFLRSEGFYQKDEWVYKRTDCCIQFMVSYDNILYCSFDGKIEINCLKFINKTLSSIFENNIISGDYFYIEDYAKTTHTDTLFRKSYLETINYLHNTFNLRVLESYICGADGPLNSMLLSGEYQISVKCQDAETVKNAIRLIRNPLNAGSGSENVVSVPIQDIENLISFVGRVAWDSDYIPDVTFTQGSPLKRVADALTIIKQDKKDLITELENRNSILKNIVNDLKVARDKAESANIAKSQFLSSMSHELRTPLNGVIGMTDILSNSDLTDEQKSSVSIIQQNGKHLLTVINDILDYSKIESGKIVLENIKFNLFSEFEQVIEMIAGKAFDKKLTLHIDIEDNVYPYLTGDPHRLRQIVLNLLGNAIKFTATGEIKCFIRVITDQQDKQDLIFEIEDTGIGIEAEKVPLVFNQFTQADSSMTRKYGGTGLGLSISKKLVELSKGCIGVKSTFGKGSTFWVVMPFVKQSFNLLSGEKQYEAQYPFIILADNEVERLWYSKLVKAVGGDILFSGTVSDCPDALRKNNATVAKKMGVIIDPSYNTIDDPASLLSKITNVYTRLIPHFFLISIPSLQSYYNSVMNTCSLQFVDKPVFPNRLKSLLNTVLNNDSASGSDKKDSHAELSSPDNALQNKTRVLRGRILIVEDVATNQVIVKRLLGKIGFENVQICNNGLEAVEVLRTQDFDLVFMDCQMPEMDGYTATEIIRNSSSDIKNHSVTVVAFTAHALKTELERCFNAGMNDFLLKPFTMEELKKILKKWGLIDF